MSLCGTEGDTSIKQLVFQYVFGQQYRRLTCQQRICQSAALLQSKSSVDLHVSNHARKEAAMVKPVILSQKPWGSSDHALIDNYDIVLPIKLLLTYWFVRLAHQHTSQLYCKLPHACVLQQPMLCHVCPIMLQHKRQLKYIYDLF